MDLLRFYVHYEQSSERDQTQYFLPHYLETHFPGLFRCIIMPQATLVTVLFHVSLKLAAATEYLAWKTFHANGINLGGWLEQESTIDTAW